MFVKKLNRRSILWLLIGLIILFVAGGAIMIRMPGLSYQGSFLPLSVEEIKIRDQLKKDVYYLAESIGERNVWKKGTLGPAANYIIQELKNADLEVREQTYQVEGVLSKNIIGVKKGQRDPEDILVVGAHYDTVPGSPGADDNASGIAGLLELVRLLKNKNISRTIHFIAFVNEESPFFFSKKMGSWQYVQQAYRDKKNITAMLSIESIGYYSEEKGTQSYPFPFGFFYPSQGNFIGFVGNLSSRRLVHKSISSFRKNTEFPSEGISAPSWVPGIGWSDQWSFWRHGYPAVMITATAPFRNPHYHTARDVPNTLDYDRMARVVLGLSHVLVELGTE